MHSCIAEAHWTGALRSIDTGISFSNIYRYPYEFLSDSYACQRPHRSCITCNNFELIHHKYEDKRKAFCEGGKGDYFHEYITLRPCGSSLSSFRAG